MKKMKVAVTGASGLVGFHVVSHLAAQGEEVIGFVRATSDTRALRQLSKTSDVRIVEMDLFDETRLVSALSGCDVVVHAAGTVDPLGKRDEIMRVNVEGTRACLQAAVRASVKQFIHISSLSVITGQADQFGVTEEAPLVYCGEAYADSKVEAEKVVMSEAGRDSVKVTILRPGFIYGPGERAWMPRLINSLRQGKAMLIDGGHKETNVIFVENLSRAVELSLLNEGAFGRVYNLTDGQKVTKKDLFDAIADGLELPRATKVMPGAIAKSFCELVSLIAPHLPVATQRNLSRYSRAAFRLAGVNQGFDISRAERELGYVDRIPFAEGMKTTLKTFKAGSDLSPQAGACAR